MGNFFQRRLGRPSFRPMAMAGKQNPRRDSERRNSGSGHRRKKWRDKKKRRREREKKTDKAGEGEDVGKRELFTAPDSVKQILPLFLDKKFITQWRETRPSGEDDVDGVDIWIFLPSGLAIGLQILRKSQNQNEQELIEEHLKKHPHITRVIVLGREDLIPILDRGDGDKEKRTKALIHKLCKIFWLDDGLRYENSLKE